MRIILLGVALIAQPALARERTLTVTSFDRMRVEGSYIVEVVTGRGASARISGSEQAIERTSVVVQGQTLVIRPGQNAWGGWPDDGGGPTTIRLTTPALRGAFVTGSATVRVDRMRGADVSVALEGSGTLNVAAIETDKLDIGLAGAGMMTLGGRAAGARAAVRGTATLDARALAVRDAKVIAQGAGAVTIAAERTADVNGSGAGSVTIVGTPACTVTRKGSGTIICGKNRN